MDLEAICSGWLIKSPSSKYVTLFSRGKLSIRVPLKSKWHRRFFVLHKPHGSLPLQYAFDYFKGENEVSSRRRGTINLEECENILSNLDSSHYPYLFSIKTKARDKDRVYYLAAESESDMMKWVNCLCSLCGLKMGTSDVLVSPPPTVLTPPAENHIVAPSPPVRHDSIQLTVDLPAQKAMSNQSLVDEELSNQILDEIEAIEQGHLKVDSRVVNDSAQLGYTELSECTTGHNGGNENFIELYDVPKPQRLAPPTRFGQSQSVRGRTKPTNNNSITGSRSANSSPMMSRTLPARPHNEPLAPPRPPKPGQHAEELYQNVSSNSPLLHRSGQPSPALSRLGSSRSTSDRFVFPSSSTVSANNSVSSSPAASRRTDGFTCHTSVDALYHNTAELSSNGATNEHNQVGGSMSPPTAQQRQHIDSIYDVPKSCNISMAIPAPTLCTGSTTQTIHKYVNASAGIISRPINNNHKRVGEEVNSCEQLDSHNGEVLELMRQPVDENHYDMSPTSRQADSPGRPFKPRNLSDPSVLEAGDDEAFQSGHHVLQVSKSFRTRAFTKDSVFSDSEEYPQTSAHEEIKLPSRINTHDSSSSSQMESSSDEEEDEEEQSGDRVESLYEVPPTPRPVQPMLPERLHNKALNHTQTMDNISLGVDNQPNNVKRSSSMSKVPAPPHGSMSKLSNMGGVSPNLANRHTKLRSERSSSVCANDWRNKAINVNNFGLSQIMPVIHKESPVVSDIQYIELDQSEDRGEPSPKPSRSSLTSMIPAANSNSLEYTDIDIIKTQALTVTRRERDFSLRKKSENMEP